jgi:hypothetical protein
MFAFKKDQQLKFKNKNRIKSSQAIPVMMILKESLQIDLTQ